MGSGAGETYFSRDKEPLAFWHPRIVMMATVPNQLISEWRSQQKSFCTASEKFPHQGYSHGQ